MFFFVRIKVKMNENVLCVEVELFVWNPFTGQNFNGRVKFSGDSFCVIFHKRPRFGFDLVWFGKRPRFNCNYFYFSKKAEIWMRPPIGLKRPRFEFDLLFSWRSWGSDSTSRWLEKATFQIWPFFCLKKPRFGFDPLFAWKSWGSNSTFYWVLARYQQEGLYEQVIGALRCLYIYVWND